VHSTPSFCSWPVDASGAGGETEEGADEGAEQGQLCVERAVLNDLFSYVLEGALTETSTRLRWRICRLGQVTHPFTDNHCTD
jgi:hypothetical protein